MCAFNIFRKKLEIIYKSDKDSVFIQRQHFQSLQTKDEWLSDSVRLNFFKSLAMFKSIIILFRLFVVISKHLT